MDTTEWEKIYGEFDKKNDYRLYTLKKLGNESTSYQGEIIKWVKDILFSFSPEQKILFTGETKKVVEQLKLSFQTKKIESCGLTNTDYKWNFEEDPPSEMKEFDLIVSQAILEHLLNPYKHMHDLTGLLTLNGYLIIHTVLPGYRYHRYPIDALRFYPDWFEEIAKKLKLTIIKRRVRKTHLFYLYKKEIV